MLKLQYESTWRDEIIWRDLGRIERPKFLFTEDEIVFSCTIFAEDIRMWEVAIGTGIIWTRNDDWYPGPIGGWGKPPKITLRLVESESEEVLILRDFVATANLDWEKFLKDKWAEMEFIKCL